MVKVHISKAKDSLSAPSSEGIIAFSPWVPRAKPFFQTRGASLFSMSSRRNSVRCEKRKCDECKTEGAFTEVSNRRATHEAVCTEVKKVSQRISEFERKAVEAHESMVSIESAPGELQMNTPEQKLR